jgi:hypothetical protein
MQEYRNQNKAIRLAKLAPAVGAPAPVAPAPPTGLPAPPTGLPALPSVLTRAKAKATKTPLHLSLKNFIRKIKPGTAQPPSPPPSPPVARLITPPSPPVASLITPPVVKPFFNITKKSAPTGLPAVILTKEDKKAIADVEKRIQADELLNAKTTAKEERERKKAEKEANKQPYFGKKKQTGKGLQKINSKYLYSYNTIN